MKPAHTTRILALALLVGNHASSQTSQGSEPFIPVAVELGLAPTKGFDLDKVYLSEIYDFSQGVANLEVIGDHMAVTDGEV